VKQCFFYSLTDPIPEIRVVVFYGFHPCKG
jgi:hypothetical protein